MSFLADFKGEINANSIGLPSSTATIDGGITAALQIAMSLLGGLAVIFIIVGGLQMVLSNGNAASFAKGRATLTYAVIGLSVALTALAIVTLVSGAFSGTSQF